jgi:hypothetical protein
MAAPANSYRTKSLFARSIDNTTDVQHLTAILQTDKATMLSRFALDGIFNVNIDGTNDGVIGYCRIGTINYTRHATARQGNLRLYDGGDCVLFNDAGLNTMGFAQVNVLKWPANRLKLTGTFTSSYYDSATKLGYEYKLANGTYYDEYYTEPVIGSNVTKAYTSYMGIGGTEGQNCTVRAFITSAEGKFYSAEVLGQLTAPVYGFLANFNASDPASTTTTSKMVYMEQTAYARLTTDVLSSASVTGIYGYQDEDLTIPTPAGYYSNLNDSSNAAGLHKVFKASATGEFNQYIAVANPVAGKDLRFDLLANANGSISVGVTLLTGAKATTISFSGKIQALNAPHGANVLGGGNFSGSITAGQTGVVISTFVTDQRNDGMSGIGSYVPVITTLTPAGTTYDVYEIMQ